MIRDDSSSRKRPKKGVNTARPRKITWTAKKRVWHDLSDSDIIYLAKFLRRTIGVPIIFKLRLLNREVKPYFSIMPILYKGLAFAKNQPFFGDGLNILFLLSQEPHAPLLAKFIAFELSLLRRHSAFIQFIKEGLMLLGQNQTTMTGFLIQIKGRLNGSDRSRRLKFRFGSLSLHTIDSPID